MSNLPRRMPPCGDTCCSRVWTALATWNCHRQDAETLAQGAWTGRDRIPTSNQCQTKDAVDTSELRRGVAENSAPLDAGSGYNRLISDMEVQQLGFSQEV